MEELIFRSSQKVENLQVQSRLFAVHFKDGLVVYINKGQLLLSNMLNSPAVINFKMHIKEETLRAITTSKELKEKLIAAANPKQIYLAMLNIFGKKWTRRDICFACGGLLVGTIIGFSVAVAMRQKEPVLRFMQAIQCTNDLGPESITVAEDAVAPYETSEYNVLVNVKAGSLHLVDIQICHGYGRTLRRTLQRMYCQSNPDVPIILGRDCTGIITDIGSKVTRLEVGDEVWLTVPFWCQGTLCQSVLIPESRVSRKPKNVGFEGASSLPYAGSIALSALVEARLDSMNAEGKKILVHGGCTPVGCVLVQLLRQWKASVTVTCYKRALPVVQALGASDAILISEVSTPTDKFVPEINVREQCNAFLKELETREEVFDVIINTDGYCELSTKELRNFLKIDGAVISTLPPLIESDSYGLFRRLVFSLYINLRYKLQTLLGLPINTYDETHLCSVTLDKLSQLVEDGYLQTVVDKIYHPQDIEVAVNHIQSVQSIGSTIITFRLHREAIEIPKHKNNFNKKEEGLNVHKIWHGLLSNTKTRSFRHNQEDSNGEPSVSNI